MSRRSLAQLLAAGVIAYLLLFAQSGRAQVLDFDKYTPKQFELVRRVEYAMSRWSDRAEIHPSVPIQFHYFIDPAFDEKIAIDFAEAVTRFGAAAGVRVTVGKADFEWLAGHPTANDSMVVLLKDAEPFCRDKYFIERYLIFDDVASLCQLMSDFFSEKQIYRKIVQFNFEKKVRIRHIQVLSLNGDNDEQIRIRLAHVGLAVFLPHIYLRPTNGFPEGKLDTLENIELVHFFYSSGVQYGDDKGTVRQKMREYFRQVGR